MKNVPRCTLRCLVLLGAVFLGNGACQAPASTPDEPASRSADGLTFGMTAAGDRWELLGSNAKSVTKVSLAEAGVVASLSSYQAGVGTAGSQAIRGVIYADDGAGKPGALAATTQEVIVSGTAAAGWVTYAFASPVRLSAGTYWLGLLSGERNQLTKRAYASATAGSAAWNADSYTDGASSPFGTVNAYGTRHSIYATYSTDAAPPPSTDAGTPQPQPQPSATSLGQLYLDWEEVPLIDKHAGLYSWMVLQSYMREHVKIDQLKAANPQMRLFMYFESAGSYAEASDAQWPSGMPYQWVKRNHPDWILEDGSGNDITFWGGALHLFDVGNTAYQDEWAKRAIQYAQSAGFHGVLADDVNVGEAFRQYWSAKPAKYVTDAAWTKAVEAFLNNVAPKLRAAGLSLVPNVASVWNSDRATQVRWAKIAGGYAREHYETWSGDNELLGGADWDWMASLHRDIVAAKVPFYAFPHGGGAQATDKMRYTRCSFLLWHEPAVGGAYAYSTGGSSHTGQDPYNAAWAFDLGAPTGPAVKSSAGVWSRSFAGGRVVVDPKAKTASVE